MIQMSKKEFLYQLIKSGVCSREEILRKNYLSSYNLIKRSSDLKSEGRIEEKNNVFSIVKDNKVAAAKEKYEQQRFQVWLNRGVKSFGLDSSLINGLVMNYCSSPKSSVIVSDIVDINLFNEVKKLLILWELESKLEIQAMDFLELRKSIKLRVKTGKNHKVIDDFVKVFNGKFKATSIPTKIINAKVQEINYINWLIQIEEIN